VVVTTGGLGPTEDDLTRDVVASVAGRELVLHDDLLAHIETLFQRIGYRMPDNNRRQAYIPEGAEVVSNPRGTAPAFRLEIDGRALICLPGVPMETEPLIREAVLPYLRERFTPGGQVLLNRVLKVSGQGESSVDAQIRDLIRSSTNPVIGLQASPGEIKVRLTAQADTLEAAAALLDATEGRVRDVLGPLVFGTGDETLAGNAASLLEKRNLSLATVEAATRGAVAAEIARFLPPELYKGGRILNRSESAGTLCLQALEETGADVALAVAAFPDRDDRIRVEIMVRSRDARQADRVLSLGGPDRMVQSRSSTMALFTLLQFLKD
jgi:nicotinamide-nucleotide amidase